MSFMKGPGFPDALFDTPDELVALADELHGSVIEYLLFEAPIGALRVADPVLGDLTVVAKDAVGKVLARLEEMRAKDGTGGVPLE